MDARFHRSLFLMPMMQRVSVPACISENQKLDFFPQNAVQENWKSYLLYEEGWSYQLFTILEGHILLFAFGDLYLEEVKGSGGVCCCISGLTESYQVHTVREPILPG
ncbi:MAG: hypothetical protein ACLVGL_17165 [Waltera sp.]